MTTTSRPQPVTVGVDASRSRTLTAVEHGVPLARALDAPLRLVHASALPFEGVAFTPYEVDAAREEAAAILVRAADDAHRLGPDLAVTTHPVLGSATLALESASKESSALVVVRRDARTAERLLTGSTSSRVATHASCPVVVVPAGVRPASTGPVVVAIDADSPSHAALTYAFEAARRARTDLLVLHAAHRGGATQGQRGVGETLAGWREDYPEVEVHTRTVEASTVDACADATRGARLLVLGRHRTTGPRAPWTRSIAKAVLSRTACPVVTVPHDAVDLAYHPTPRAMAAPGGPVY
ncbi:universal stress protein [Mumia sp. DW29H23]|uniref:universal stress protein n=1 Tax=Mumia sp. DW29H23 TaxID=3421241 RepID=UPI003D684E9B